MRPYVGVAIENMTFDSMNHHRRSIRLAGYDYSQEGAYFVTISVARRVRRNNPFGRAENGVMKLNGYGKIVAEEWLKTAQLRPNVILDEWMVMPNHFHGIVMFTCATNVRAHCNAPLVAPYATHDVPDIASTILHDDSDGGAHCNAPVQAGLHRAPQSLSSLVSGFKGSVTRTINAQRAARNLSPVEVWHRNFHERIIRNERELDDTRRYIAQNPQNWESDEEYTALS